MNQAGALAPPAFKGIWNVTLALTALWALFVAVRLTAPSDFLDHDQERPSLYMVDAYVNGHWLVQRDDNPDPVLAITSKPPLLTWCGAGLMRLSGGVSEWAVFLPGALAVLAIMLLLRQTGDRWFGTGAGTWAAAAFLLSVAGTKMLHLARTDGVFTFFVFLTGVLGLRAWERGRGWNWFWLAAAAATLTKGPFGLMFAAAGFLAALGAGRGGEAEAGDRPGFRLASQWPGILIFLILSGGWFLLACSEAGRPLVEKMLGRELFGHFTGQAEAKREFFFPGLYFYKPAGYVLVRFAPWSLATVLAVWTLWRRPAPAAAERRAERFWFWTLAAGVLVLGLPRHQRADLVFPLLPAAALLAGRELNRLRWPLHVSHTVILTGFSLLALTVMWLMDDVINPRKENAIRQTAAVRRFVMETDRLTGRRAAWIFVDVKAGVQFYLGLNQTRVTPEAAAQRLAGTEPVLVAVRDPQAVIAKLPPGAVWYEVAQLPDQGAASAFVLSNRSRDWFTIWAGVGKPH